MTLSRHRGPCAEPRRFVSGESDSLRPFARRTRRRFHADNHPELGPRSLDPDRPFGDAFAERIRGQTSPADFCNYKYNVRASKPELSSLARTEATTSFRFFDVPSFLVFTRLLMQER
jgi:hypothetical protein